jgi:uncharacterized protein (TIGR03382 family)
MRYLLIALTFSASAALAQTTGTIVLSGPNANETTIRVPREPCNYSRTVTWTVTTSGTICGDLEFWFVSGTSCPETRASDTPLFTRVTQSTLATTRTNTFTFETQNLPAFQGTNAVTCPSPDREDEYRLCASLKLGTAVISTDPCSTTSTQKANEFKVFYDAKPPAPPSIDNVAALDKALSVRVSTSDDDTSRVKLTIERADGTGSRTVNQSVDQPLFRVENLENGVTYRLSATAVDTADNESAASEVKEGTPIFTRGFYDRYVEAGGQEMGGCGAAGGLMGGWVLAVLGFWLSSRRNRS